MLKGDRITFEVANYYKTRPLVIDPVLVYSTYLGGNDSDYGYNLAVDQSGHAYVIGYTRVLRISPPLPARSRPLSEAGDPCQPS